MVQERTQRWPDVLALVVLFLVVLFVEQAPPAAAHCLSTCNNVYGTGDDDTISLGNASHAVWGFGGWDWILTDDPNASGSGMDEIYASDGRDSGRGGGDHDVIRGGQGDDLLHGEGGNDDVADDDSNDADNACGNNGADLVDVYDGDGMDKASGGSDSDTVAANQYDEAYQDGAWFCP